MTDESTTGQVQMSPKEAFDAILGRLTERAQELKSRAEAEASAEQTSLSALFEPPSRSDLGNFDSGKLFGHQIRAADALSMAVEHLRYSSGPLPIDRASWALVFAQFILDGGEKEDA